jgi:hypothetical protein
MMPMRHIAGYAVLACLEGFDVLRGDSGEKPESLFRLGHRVVICTINPLSRPIP